MQPLNVVAAIDGEPPTETVASFVQPSNALLPRLTEFVPSIFSEVSAAWFLNTPTPTPITLAGRTSAAGSCPLNPVTVVPEES